MPTPETSTSQNGQSVNRRRGVEARGAHTPVMLRWSKFNVRGALVDFKLSAMSPRFRARHERIRGRKKIMHEKLPMLCLAWKEEKARCKSRRNTLGNDLPRLHRAKQAGRGIVTR